MIVTAKGKQKCVYRWYATPWEILRPLPGFLRAELTVDQLQQTDGAKSDTQAAMEMREAKRKLFACSTRGARKNETGEDRGNDGRVENEENHSQVSLRFPQPLEIAARFPHSHRPGGLCVSKPFKTKFKKGDPGGGSLRSPFRLILQ